MKGLSDIELLDAYAGRDSNSEDAFRELVARHIDFIYSAAMRQLRNTQLSQEATQSAFIALAGKAGTLRRGTVIAGWLHRAVHFAALNLQRSEARRKHWEEEAASMNVPGNADSDFQELALPHVDGALAELSGRDRDAVLLRFLRQQSFRDLAQILGISEEAAKKRVNRALERLRGLLKRRGVTISVAALAVGLSRMPVSAAPAALASTVSALAASNSVPAISTIQTILKIMTTTKALVITILIILIILGGSTALLRASRRGDNIQATRGPTRSSPPRINVTSVMVDDQDKALKFYTEVLGFVKKLDVPTGEPGGARWLTVVSPEELDGTQLLLEPMGFAPARMYQKELFEAGYSAIALASGDVQKQFERLKSLGVTFRIEPTRTGTTTRALFEDTCGNYIQILQMNAASNSPAAPALKIKSTVVFVNDVDKALKFYTEVLGFVKKTDMPGRSLSLVSPQEPDGSEVLLDPGSFAPARTFQQAVRKAGIPFTQFAVVDIQETYARLMSLGVVFFQKPTRMGPTTMVVFDDTCGNFIQLIQQ